MTAKAREKKTEHRRKGTGAPGKQGVAIRIAGNQEGTIDAIRNTPGQMLRYPFAGRDTGFTRAIFRNKLS
jgi:hypothetical protein